MVDLTHPLIILPTYVHSKKFHVPQNYITKYRNPQDFPISQICREPVKTLPKILQTKILDPWQRVEILLLLKVNYTVA